METPAAKRTSRRKRARRRPRVDPVFYVVEIREWEWSFCFGIGAAPLHDGHYHDYRHFVVKGKLLRPSKVRAEKVELSFLPEQRLNPGQREQGQLLPSIGSLNRYRGHLSGIFCLPSDALPLLLTMATAERLRYVVLQGDAFHYSHASVRSFRFEMQVDEDDLPGEA